MRNFRLFLAYRILTRLLLFAPYIPHYTMEVRGLSASECGLLQGLYYLVVVAAELPTGALADRFGRKANLAFGAAINGIGCYVFANPMAKKLEIRSREELLVKEMIIEGILAIQSGDNPKMSKTTLLTG